MHEDTRWVLYAVLLLVVAAMAFLGNAQAAGLYLSEVDFAVSRGTGGVANPTNTFGADAAWTNLAGQKAFRPSNEKIDTDLYYKNTVAENDLK